ncbi:MAG: hypothetical protein JWQ96_1776 [Segetibacter sp.]|nr:hypothetical protein [Segetibacter sp.]
MLPGLIANNTWAARKEQTVQVSDTTMFNSITTAYNQKNYLAFVGIIMVKVAPSLGVDSAKMTPL